MNSLMRFAFVLVIGLVLVTAGCAAAGSSTYEGLYHGSGGSPDSIRVELGNGTVVNAHTPFPKSGMFSGKARVRVQRNEDGTYAVIEIVDSGM